MSVVLDLEPDANYEPSESEVIEYGKWLGMDLPGDEAFLWIAREGLKAPLPENWKACKSEKGELYYFNFKTGQSMWDHPSDDHYRELFNNEKANPTVHSVAKGAKRVEEPKPAEKSPPKQPKTVKKKKTSSKGREAEEKKDVPSPDQVSKLSSAPKTESQPQQMQALKPILQKKELPGSLQITPLAGNAKKLESTATGMKATPEITSAPSDSDSSEVSSPVKGRINEPDALSLPDKLAAGGGINGLKALSKLNSPSVAAADMKKEKEKVAQLNREELDAFRKEQGIILQKQMAEIKQQNEAELEQHRANADVERKKEIKKIQSQTEAAISEERSKLENEIEKGTRSLREELEAKRASELQRLRDKYSAQLDHDKRKVEAETAHVLESYTREKRQESEIHKEAQAQALQEVSKGIVDVRQCASSFTRAYEEAFTAFLEGVKRSEDQFVQEHGERQESMARELDGQFEEVQQKHEERLEAAKRNFQESLRELEKSHSDTVRNTKEANMKEVEALREELSRLRDEAQKEHTEKEHQRFIETLSTFQEAQKNALEPLRAELLKTQTELNEATQQRARERETSPGIGAPAAAGDHPRLTRPSLDREAISHARGEDARTPTSSPAATVPSEVTTDMKAAITEVLREVFAGSPFIIPSPAMSLTGPRASRTSIDAGGTFGLGKSSFSPPSGNSPLSYQEQIDLVESERRRVQQGHQFVREQQQSLEERRQQLKRTRHQWKQDVLVAKQEGVRSSSKRGQLLNKVRLALEEQAQGLEYDSMILRDSQAWLLSKEQRLSTLERQIEEQDRLRGRDGTDTSNLNNCSIDTAALMTGFFKPHRFRNTSVSDAGMAPRRESLGGYSPMLSTPATSPLLSKTLNRIERRLDEVTSIIQLQQQQSGRVSPSSRRNTSTSPTLHRPSLRSTSKQDIGKRESQTHLDPWQNA